MAPTRLTIASPAVKWKGDSGELIKKYEAVLKEYSQNTCEGPTRNKFQELFRKFRAEGFYIPFTSARQIDRKTIEEHLPLIRKKLAWLKRLRKTLPSKSKFPKYPVISKGLKEALNRQLNLKKQYEITKGEMKRTKIRAQSAKSLAKLRTEFEKFTKSIPFLLSFQFPVDHFGNRLAYETAKVDRNSDISQNEIFFKRKILEDGALDPDHTRSDLYLRSTLDSIALRLKEENHFLPEDIRYDLEWAMDLVKGELRRGRKVQHSRLSEWMARTEKGLQFYESLLTPELNPAQDKVVREKIESTEALKSFVYEKHTDAYSFFSNQDEAIQALFVLDQILLNEAGRATDYNYRDRRDIAQVVINRKFHPEYSQLSPTETLYQNLQSQKSLTDKQIQSNTWLNVMFKEEQFSFTLYFIPAVEFVFCPDFYRTAAATRKKNLALAADLLTKPNSDFKALRYFSRFSMIGKIDVSRLWPGYTPIAEAPGRVLKQTASLKSALVKGAYRYLYNFTASDGVRYHVLEIKKQTYAVTGFPTKPKFFNYRDPHKFTYFEAHKPIAEK